MAEHVYTPEEIDKVLAEAQHHGNAVNCQGSPIETYPDSQRREAFIAIIEQLRSERDEAKRDHKSYIDTCKPGYVGNKVLAWTPCCPKNKPCQYHGDQRR